MRSLVLSTFAATLLASGFAYAGGSATAAADTYVRYDNSGPYGHESQIVVKNAGSQSTTRVGLIRFGGVEGSDALEATLSLDVASFNNGSGNATFYVWGVRQDISFIFATLKCAELFDENSILWNNDELKYLDTSSDNVVDASSPYSLCIYGGQPLGSFTINAGDLGSTVTFKSSKLAQFMRDEDYNNTITLLITRSSANGGSLNTSFASKEHATLQPPRLSWISMNDGVVAVADTYVKRKKNSGPFGSEPEVLVKNVGKKDNTRKGFIRFEGVQAENVVDAALALDVSSFDGDANTATFYVYGIHEDYFWGSFLLIGCQEEFNESTLRYKDAGLEYLDDSDDGVVGPESSYSLCLYNQQKLGTLTISKSDVGSTVYFKSPALNRFLQSDQNGKVTFLITRKENASFGTGFASREHPTLQPARLYWTNGNGIDLPDWEQSATQNPDGSYDYVGELRIPVAGGQYVTLPGANVTMTFGPTGNLKTISGTVGFIELPGTGLFDALGDIGTSGPALSIGYDYAYNFNTVDLPLDDNARYFYFLLQNGASIEWGPMSLATPNAGATLLVLDASAPAFFVFTDQFLPESPITSVALGVSGADTIPFDPRHTKGVEPYMTPFYGDLYLGGSVDIPTQIPGVSVSVEGDMTLNVNDDHFVAAHPENWIEDLGTNADVFLTFGIGWFSFSNYLGGSSLLYQRHGEGNQPSLTFSGEIAPDDLPLMPVSFNGSGVNMAGYLSPYDDGNNSYVELEGRLDLGISFTPKIDARLTIDKNGAALDGKIDFDGLKVDIAGEIDGNHVSFSGSVEKGFGIHVDGVGGEVKAKIKVSFDSAKGEVSLKDTTAKACLDGLGCVSAGIDELTIKSNGAIRICVKAFGEKLCHTF